MPLYDGIGRSVQVGDDLNQHSSGGWHLTGVPTANQGDVSWWDGVADVSSNDATNSAIGLADIIEHQGTPYVAWVEPEGVSGHLVGRGPYVARLDGDSWTLLGGELEPALTQTHSATWIDRNPGSPIFRAGPHYNEDLQSMGLGTRFLPARPRLASDGTDLYLAYTVHVVAVGRNPPPDGAYINGDPYLTVVSGNKNKWWAARRVLVKRWDGATWSDFGDIPAITNNYWGARSADAGYHGDFATELGLTASPSDPGVCHVAFFEEGVSSPVDDYTYVPHFFVGFVFGPRWLGPVAARKTVIRLDGSSLTGSESDVYALDSGGFVPFASGVDLFDLDPRRRSNGSSIEVRNPDGVVYAFTSYRGVGVNPTNDLLEIIRIPDLTVLQSQLVANVIISRLFNPAMQMAVSHDPDRNVFYVNRSREPFVREITDDGSADFQPLDFDLYGTAVWEMPRTIEFEFGVDSGGLWAGPGVLQYHRRCPGWFNHGNIAYEIGPGGGSPTIGNDFPFDLPMLMVTWGLDLGDFTADALAAMALAAGFRTVAVQLSQVTAGQVATLQAAGLMVVAWGSTNGGTAGELITLGVDGWMPQVEGPGERDAAIAAAGAGAGAGLPWAAVTNYGGIDTVPDGQLLRDAGFTALAVEVYATEGPPHEDIDAMLGAGVTYGFDADEMIPVLGLFAGEVPSDYTGFDSDVIPNFGTYNAEQTSEAAWAELADLESSGARRPLRLVGDSALIEVGDDLYIAGGFRSWGTGTVGGPSPFDNTVDVKIKVFRVPIRRNVYSCGGGGVGVIAETHAPQLPYSNLNQSG